MASRSASRSSRWLAVLLVVGVLAVGSDLFITWRQVDVATSRAAVPAGSGARSNYQYLMRLVQGLTTSERSSLVNSLDGALAASGGNLRVAHNVAATSETENAVGTAATETTTAPVRDDRVRLEIEALKRVEVERTRAEATARAEVAADIASVEAATPEPESGIGQVMNTADTQLVTSLDAVAQRTSSKRGIVMPLNDRTAASGVGLLLDLRATNADLPFDVEVPHCGDLSERLQKALLQVRELRPIRFYDVCERAAAATSEHDPSRKLFCEDEADCRHKFGGGSNVRTLSVVLSEFEEVMLMEPAMLFFRTPMSLWESDKFVETGTVLFHDRISQPDFALGNVSPDRAATGGASDLHHYLTTKTGDFLPLFSAIPTLERPTPTATPVVPLPFMPSDFLLESHAYNNRTGHQTDAALIVWSKRMQRRATAMLASFLALKFDAVPRPPSHSDKELFFMALELAETRYAFSDYAIGAIGSDFRDHGPGKSVVCGSAAHYLPSSSVSPSPLFFMTSTNFLAFEPLDRTVYYPESRSASEFPGSFTDRGLPQGCPFDITGVAINELEMNRVLFRKKFQAIAQTWETIVKASDGENVRAPWTEDLTVLIRMIKSGQLLAKEPSLEEKLKQEETKKIKALDADLVYTLHQVSQRTTEPRGVVLPLYDNIAKLGMSLILELRALGVDLPVEIPMCGGDVGEVTRELFSSKKHLGRVRVYDACEMAADTVSLADPKRMVFCEDLSRCQKRFRNFDIKLLGVFFSKFEEVMLLDADTTFFQSPMALWETEKYKTTGTLFFNDRIVHPEMYLGAPVDGKPGITRMRDYLSTFKVELFKDVPTLQRPNATLPNAVDLPLQFEPSDNLLGGHPWNGRAGHQMDSSCVLWNKKKQPRATAILLSFIAVNQVRRPPSYGDKELFHISCELAETQYAFSDYGIGAIGYEKYEHGDDASRVCGSMSQYFPVKPAAPGRGGSLFYLNSDHILSYKPSTRAVYYSKARPAELYPGPMPDERYDCPWNITILQLTDAHADQLLYRQQMHEVVLEWDTIATDTAMTGEEKETKSRELEGKLDEIFTNVRDLQKHQTDLIESEAHLAYTLHKVTQQTTKPRGIVIPMYERITLLGLSLVLELRAMGIDLPVEIPHCGDIDAKVQETFLSYKPLGEVRFYDACALAVKEKSAVDKSTNVFCANLEECEKKFRGFEVKILAVVYSQFEEIMLMDADTIFFRNPAELFESEKFQTTGTLFFHDRAAHEVYFLSSPLNDGSNNTVFHQYMAQYDVAPFRAIPTLERPKATVPNPVDLELPFEPSDFLLKSNVWNKLTGHQMDSSLVFWSKKKQPRATAILASFITAGDVPRPPSYGDKEFFFTACELAETQYSFSDFGISGFGTDFQDHGELNSTVCGTMAQVYPIKPEDPTEEVGLLHANSDFILVYTPKNPDKPLYYAKGRPAEYYPGPFGERRMECPFDITGGRLTVDEEDHILLRQQLSKDLEVWQQSATGMVPGEPVLQATQSPEADADALTQIRKRVQVMEDMETELIHSLNQVSQRTTARRGVVLPLFDDIASLGVSLVLDLRALSVRLPIEIPHCGDLSAATQAAWQNHKAVLGDVRVYDVCEQAFQAVSSFDPNRKLFCKNIGECRRKFRSFDIKVLALVFSQFEEVMLMDADTIFFQTPMALWDTGKYLRTGVLLFNDRISQEDGYLGGLVRSQQGKDVPAIHDYLSRFDVSLFRHLRALPRTRASVDNTVDVKLSFEPSDVLLSSHAWNGRAGHLIDSSLVLWNKKRQPRATALLASFVSLNSVPRPPSYGEKELFFFACELAETAYAVSDFGVGAVGTDLTDRGEDKSTLCGDMAHYFPVRDGAAPAANAPLLYLNSDNIMAFDPETQPVYYSRARPADFFPGAFGSRPQECPFNITGIQLSTSQREHLTSRQRFFSMVQRWTSE